LNKFISEHSSSFEKKVIYKASLAAGPLADWVTAILQYSIVLDKVQPLEDKLNKVNS